MNQAQLLNFLGFWAAASLLIFIGSLLVPANVVLGNDKVGAFAAVLVSGFILVALDYIVIAVIRNMKIKIKNEYAWPVMFLVINGVILWIIKRFADLTGVGISNFVYVGVLAIAITAAHLGITKLSGIMKEAPVSKKK